LSISVEQTAGSTNLKPSSHAASQKSLKFVPSSSKVKSQLNASLTAADKLKSQKKMSKKAVEKNSPEKPEDEDDSGSDSEEEDVEVVDITTMNPPRKVSTVRFTEAENKLAAEGTVIGENKEKQDQSSIKNAFETPIDTAPSSSQITVKPQPNAVVAHEPAQNSNKPSSKGSDNTQFSPFTLMKRPSTLPKGNFLRHALLLAPVNGKYIVKPHPTRGFRLWIIKRSVSCSFYFSFCDITFVLFF
jgi:hypothetical protein